MKMSVSPIEIAEHLISELGPQKALETYRYHLGRCIDEETAGIWTNIGSAIEAINTTDKR